MWPCFLTLSTFFFLTDGKIYSTGLNRAAANEICCHSLFLPGPNMAKITARQITAGHVMVEGLRQWAKKAERQTFLVGSEIANQISLVWVNVESFWCPSFRHLGKSCSNTEPTQRPTGGLQVPQITGQIHTCRLSFLSLLEEVTFLAHLRWRRMFC